MAIPFVQSIDMNDFQLLNFVVHSAGSSPTNASGLGGMMWWDSTNYDLKVYNDDDSAWNSLTQGPASSTNGYIPQWSGTIGNKLSTGLLLTTSIGTPGVDTSIPTEKAVRDAIGTALSGGVEYKGGYNATTNTPDLETPSAGTVFQGDMYTVTNAGDFFTEAVDVGDVLIAETDDPSALGDWTRVNRNIAENFTELSDTPANYTSSGGYMVMVNSTPDALEFVDPSGYNLSNFNNDLITPAALTKTDDTNVTLSLGGTPATALLQATSISVGWTGTLANSRGGTGTGTYTLGDILWASAANTLSKLPIGAANQHLSVNGAGNALVWVNPPTGATAHNLLSVTHGDTVASAVSRGSIIIGNATPAWEELTIGAADTFLKSDGTDAAWASVDFDDLGTTPTTLAGYGISDTKANFDTALSDGSFAFDGGAFHDGFSDYVANEHVDHSTVSIATAATSGLNGGGDITTTRNLILDVSRLTAVTTLVDADELAVYVTGTGQRKITWANLKSEIGSEIDLADLTAGSGLSGGPYDGSSAITFDLDINSLTTETTIAGGDFLPFWDITATATNKKISFTNFMTAVESALDDKAFATVVTGDVPSGIAPTVTHNLNKTEVTDIQVQIWRQSDGKLVGVEVTGATADTVTLNFGAAAINPSSGTYRFVVIGVQE
jgi:hypothetical protein